MKKIRTIGSAAIVAALLLAVAPSSQASIVNVFLDDGSRVAGSSNTSMPFGVGDRDLSWDVSATAENGLTAIGAAVMEVRMVTYATAYSRGTHNFGYWGLAVQGGSNSTWLDAGEGAAFELSFFSDAGKTTEITGLDITFKSLTSRVHGAFINNFAMNAYASSSALSVLPTPLTDASVVKVGIYNLFGTTQDDLASDTSDAGLLATTLTDSADYYTAFGTDSVVFNEDDVFWLRRENLGGVLDQVYELGAVTFDVVPEPATLGLFALVGGGMAWIRRRSAI